MSIATRLANNDPLSELEEAFFEFHRRNPGVYTLFREFTVQMKKVGRKTYSCHSILHRVRWETAIQTDSDDGLKINNNFSAYYSRLLMDNEKNLKGFFRTRKVLGEKTAEA